MFAKNETAATEAHTDNDYSGTGMMLRIVKNFFEVLSFGAFVRQAY